MVYDGKLIHESTYPQRSERYEELEIDASYDAAFVHYIKYKCLRSDTDAGNRAYGDEEMQAFSMYITREARDFALDNQISGNRVIEYRGFI